MNFTQIGYQSALIDLGIVKEAAIPGGRIISRVANRVKGVFTRSPKQLLPMGGHNPGPMIHGLPGDESAVKALRSEFNAAQPFVEAPKTLKGPKVDRSKIPDPPAPIVPPAPKNPVAPEAPAMTPPQNEAAGGLLAKIRRNPVKSVGIAGAGAGGLGYVMGQGAQQQKQPMQQYGQPQQMY